MNIKPGPYFPMNTKQGDQNHNLRKCSPLIKIFGWGSHNSETASARKRTRISEQSSMEIHLLKFCYFVSTIRWVSCEMGRHFVQEEGVINIRANLWDPNQWASLANVCHYVSMKGRLWRAGFDFGPLHELMSVIKRAVQTTLAAASDCICEVHPNGQICLLILGHYKDRLSQFKKAPEKAWILLEEWYRPSVLAIWTAGTGGPGAHHIEVAVCCQDGQFWAWLVLEVENLGAPPALFQSALVCLCHLTMAKMHLLMFDL